jgi:SAM-dependent methyltransferase
LDDLAAAWACKDVQDVGVRPGHPAAMTRDYVHGYGRREERRLHDQAGALAELLHAGTRYPAGCSVLEVGCGVGAQTVILARNSPEARFTSIDVSAASVEQARARVRAAGIENVRLARADLFERPFPGERFDHAFVCFVLEHLADPARALACVRARLRPGGSLTVIEGDHGSALFHPDGAEARRAIEALVALQARVGGDARVGRRLYPLLRAAGLARVEVSPRLVYADGGRRALARSFTLGTFTAMVEGVRDRALAAGLLDRAGWDAAIRQLRRTAGPEGVFCYTFFKGVGFRPARGGPGSPPRPRPAAPPRTRASRRAG